MFQLIVPDRKLNLREKGADTRVSLFLNMAIRVLMQLLSTYIDVKTL